MEQEVNLFYVVATKKEYEPPFLRQGRLWHKATGDTRNFIVLLCASLSPWFKKELETFSVFGAKNYEEILDQVFEQLKKGNTQMCLRSTESPLSQTPCNRLFISLSF